ncbi:hypothetical protein D3273_01035 [Lichenibacterium minor]|uniref:Uncharacterized protein n=1 Tax=Lichenibacterium minor TaxID=2316528 RepID=A0A4Q2UB35_9HYPH|nr:hypothetical protein [Lichenibacterium minor]RYC33870.1 hypothetical protein D3273_01035 [Lichenibacterium minor]
MEPARRAVEMWRDRLAVAARNLADLNDSDDVRHLRARLAGLDAFEGATLAQARRVAASLDGLWADYLLVARTVDEAAALARRPLFGQPRDGDAAALLDGPSIRLPAVSVPLRARGLLDSAERSAAVTPSAMLDAMVEGFEAARRGAAAIAAAVTANCIKLDGLRAEPAARGQPMAARLDAAARALDRDPLGAAALLAPLPAALAVVRAEAEALERHRAALAGEVALARADLVALELAVARRDAARRGAAGLDIGPSADAAGAQDFAGGPQDFAAGLQDLAAWLDRLAALAAAGAGAAAVGLGRWRAACAEARRAAQAEADGIAARSRERDDLRGRFRALLAKAEAARGTPPPFDPVAVAAALDAEPFDAGRARALLANGDAGFIAAKRAT